MDTTLSRDVDANTLEDDPDESETDQADTEGAILADMMEETTLDEDDAETDADQVDLVWELPVCVSMATNHHPSDFP
jgi:hypothetical protein